VIVAEACGWPTGCYAPPNEQPEIPDYANDLNAMHEAEETLGPEQARQYHNRLGRTGAVWLWHATARQRCEAFLRTIGKWTP
jgi:hypothetical protein